MASDSIPTGQVELLGQDDQELRDDLQFQAQQTEFLQDMLNIVHKELAKVNEQMADLAKGDTPKDKEDQEIADQKGDTEKTDVEGSKTGKFGSAGAKPTEPGVERVQEGSIPTSGQREPEETVEEPDDPSLAEAVEALQAELLAQSLEISKLKYDLEQAQDEAVIGEGSVETSDFVDTADIVLSSDAEDGDYPFKITYDSSSAYVREGLWTRRGIGCLMQADPGQETFEITGPGNPAVGAWAINTTYIIYLELEDSTGLEDPAVRPNICAVYADTTIPPEANSDENTHWEIGTITTDGAGAIESKEQLWFGGWIDDIGMVPDGVSNYDGDGGQYNFESLNYDTTRNFHNGNLQIHNWSAPSPIAVAFPGGGLEVEDNDLFIFQDVSEQNKPVTYIRLDEIALSVSPYLNYEVIAEEINIYINDPGTYPDAQIDHNALEASTNATNGDFATGFGQDNEDHDKRYLRYEGASATVEAKDFITEGIFTAGYGQTYEASLAQQGDPYAAKFTDGNRDATFADGVSAGDFIDLAGFTAFICNGNASVETHDGTYGASLSTGFTAVDSTDAIRNAELCNGSEAGYFIEGSYEVKLCDGTTGVDATDGGLIARLVTTSPDVTAGWFDGSDNTTYIGHYGGGTGGYNVDCVTGLGINVHATGDYYHNDVQGQTLANWYSGGIVTGTDIAEYSVRVIPAGGGAPFNIKVLGRPYP